MAKQDKYLVLFSKHQDYSDSSSKPAVAHCIKEDDVHYSVVISPEEALSQIRQIIGCDPRFIVTRQYTDSGFIGDDSRMQIIGKLDEDIYVRVRISFDGDASGGRGILRSAGVDPASLNLGDTHIPVLTFEKIDSVVRIINESLRGYEVDTTLQ